MLRARTLYILREKPFYGCLWIADWLRDAPWKKEGGFLPDSSFIGRIPSGTVYALLRNYSPCSSCWKSQSVHHQVWERCIYDILVDLTLPLRPFALTTYSFVFFFIFILSSSANVPSFQLNHTFISSASFRTRLYDLQLEHVLF